MNLRVTVEGDKPIYMTMRELLDNNDDLRADEEAIVMSIRATGKYQGGGGAAPSFAIERA